VSVFRGEDEIGTAVILYGAPEKPTPKGTFKVIAKATDHYSRSYDAPMPFMLRLTDDGIAIHASRVRPNGATHGCLGVPLRFAELLFRVAGMGTEVFILADPAPQLGKTA
jgi:lipoprotein-anchoring transpeptidase ErfK/SrfK